MFTHALLVELAARRRAAPAINLYFMDRCADFLVFHVNVFSFEQAERCICLSNSFDNFENQLLPLNCTYTCNESGLLSTECGGESAFNVFLTDTTDLTVKSRCLSLQCGDYPIFSDHGCGDSLRSICIKPVDDNTTAKSWNQMKEYCKDIGVYPIGNLTLLKTTMACTESMHENPTPLWIGIVKDLYQNEDQGQLIPTSEQISIKRCMKCRFDYTTKVPDCQYNRCNDKLNTQRRRILRHHYLNIQTQFIQKPQQEFLLLLRCLKPHRLLLLIWKVLEAMKKVQS